MLRNEIMAIVKAGGTVCFPIKYRHQDHVEDAKIGRGDDKIRVNTPYEWQVFDNNIEEAVDYFIKRVFTRKNIVLAYKGIRNRKMTDVKWLYDLDEKELRVLVQKYFDDYFDQDYPNIGSCKK